MPEVMENPYPAPAAPFNGHLVVLGAGHAGAVAAHAARRANPHAAITLIGEEPHLPYERPALSKEVLAQPPSTSPSPKFDAPSYASARIALHQGQRIESIDRTNKTLHALDGCTFGYDRLVIATGSRVRQWPEPISLARRVRYLRTHEDAVALQQWLAPGLHLAVIGAGFIGLEVAAAAHARGARVTVVDRAATVLSRVLPANCSARIAGLHRQRGVRLMLGEDIHHIDAQEHGVRIELGSGPLLADLVLVGIGVLPNSELAQAAGLAVTDGIVVDDCGRTNDPCVFSAGEVTMHPVCGGAARRIESWQVAEMQAAAAGATAAGVPTTYNAIPWFWSDQFCANIQVAGDMFGAGETVTRGTEAGPCSLIRIDEHQQVGGAVCFDAPQDMAALRRIMQRNVRVDTERMADPSQPLRQWLS